MALIGDDHMLKKNIYIGNINIVEEGSIELFQKACS